MLLALLTLIGCTDTTMSKVGAYGNPHKITCYSGGVAIYDGYSTGKVHSPKSSDGWEFRDSETDRLLKVSGACVLITLDAIPQH